MVVRSPPAFLNAATSASSSSHTFSGDLQTYDLVRLLQLHFVSQSVEYVCKLIGNEYVLNILIYFREYLNKYIYNSVLPPYVQKAVHPSILAAFKNVTLQRHFDILQRHIVILQRHIDIWQRHMISAASYDIWQCHTDIW